jgi:hypothetical protein
MFHFQQHGLHVSNDKNIVIDCEWLCVKSKPWTLVSWGHFALCHHQDTGLLLPLLIQCYKALMPFVFGNEVQVQSSDP